MHVYKCREDFETREAVQTVRELIIRFHPIWETKKAVATFRLH